MTDDIDLKSLLEEPEYEQRGHEFAEITYWDINNSLVDRGIHHIKVMGSGSGYYDSMMDNMIKRMEPLADETGFVSVGSMGAGIGDEEIDNTVGSNVNDLKRRRRESEIFSAHNYAASFDLNVENDVTFSVKDYEWDIIDSVFDTIAEYAIRYNAQLNPKISAVLYQRHNGTVCIQMFFSFIFNDDSKAQSQEFISSQLKRLIPLVQVYKSGFRRFELEIDSES